MHDALRENYFVGQKLLERLRRDEYCSAFRSFFNQNFTRFLSSSARGNAHAFKDITGNNAQPCAYIPIYTL